MPERTHYRKLYKPVVEVPLEATAVILQIRARDVPLVQKQISDAMKAGRGYRLLIRNVQGFITLIEHDTEALTAPPYEIKVQIATQEDYMFSVYHPSKGYRGKWNRVEMAFKISAFRAFKDFLTAMQAYMAARERNSEPDSSEQEDFEEATKEEEL